MRDLPGGWVCVTGADAFEFVTSGSRGWAQHYSENGAAFIRIGNLNHGTISLDLNEIQRVRPPKGAEGERTLLRPNDILISITAELGMVGLVQDALGDAYINQHIALARPRHGNEPRYLAWYLASEADGKRQLQEMRRGAVKAGLGLEDIRSIEIPLPPLPEQKRIADKLDALLARVDACRERLDRVPGILKRFRQSVLAAATSGELTREWREERGDDGEMKAFHFEDADVFSDYVFPATWQERRLADLSSVTGGITKDSKKQDSSYIELPYLRVANVQRGNFDLSEMKTIRVPPERLTDLLLRAGDVLFTEGGDIDKLGRGWVWGDEIPKCVFQNHIFRARLLDPAFEPRFFSWYGNSRGYSYFLARGKQTTNLASINKSVLCALPVAVPPAEEQAEIVRRVNELFQRADRLERSLSTATERAATLTPTALAKAFRGELVPQDPNDEPASELLARIRARPEASGKTNKPKRGGTRGSRMNAKADENMLTRKDVTRTHLTTILKERGALTAEALWSASQLEIDDFYDQLKDEEARGLLRENRGSAPNAPRLLEPAA